jgi:hypothetical protein
MSVIHPFDILADDRELLDLIERREKVQRDFGTAHSIPALDAAVEYLVRLRDRTHASTARAEASDGTK